MRPGLVIGLAGGLVALLVLGYVIFGGGSGDGAGSAVRDGLSSAGLIAQACPLRFGATPGASAGVTAVLVDRSAFTRGASDAPDYAAALRGEVDKAIGRGDTVVVGGFDGTSATVRWSVTETAFTGDPGRAATARSDVLGCVHDRVAAAARARPDAPNSDVLGAIHAAWTPLAAAAAGHRTLLVATDGLVNMGCADLNAVSTGGDAGRVVDRCRAELPQLPDTAVTVLALGDTAGDTARPDSDQVTWLGGLWTALCAKITTAPCAVTTVAVADRVADPVPSDAAPDEQVVWPAADTHRSGDTVRVSLPDRLLFDTDSDQLRPDAAGALASVIDTVRQAGGTVVEVVGHTDGRGTPEHNDLLSLGRAQRVADVLRTEYGMAAPARGVGEREPKCGPETRPDGSPDEVALQCNRRVEVVIRVGAS